MVRKRADSKLIIAALPAYNEERTIAKTVIHTNKHVNEVLVVDDGSDDDTAVIAEELGATVLRHARNIGKGEALKTIFKAAKKLKPDVLVTLDADAQHDPSQIPKIIRPILEGEADIVIGSRATRPLPMPKFRRLGQRFLDLATNVRDEDGMIVDSQSGFRAYSKKAIARLDFGEWGMGVESETLKKALEEGLAIRQIPVSIEYGGEMDHKLNPMLHFTDVLSAIIKVSVVRRPLRFLGVPAAVILAIGLYGWLQVLATYNATKEFAIGNALVHTIIVLTGFFLAIAALILFAFKQQA